MIMRVIYLRYSHARGVEIFRINDLVFTFNNKIIKNPVHPVNPVKKLKKRVASAEGNAISTFIIVNFSRENEKYRYCLKQTLP